MKLLHLFALGCAIFLVPNGPANADETVEGFAARLLCSETGSADCGEAEPDGGDDVEGLIIEDERLPEDADTRIDQTDLVREGLYRTKAGAVVALPRAASAEIDHRGDLDLPLHGIPEQMDIAPVVIAVPEEEGQ